MSYCFIQRSLLYNLNTKYIPIIDMLNIIKDYVNNDDQCTRKTTIPQDKILDLVNMILSITLYTFNSQFYQTTDGVTMGGPASSTTAEIYMQANEQMDWEWFADDIYSIFK